MTLRCGWCLTGHCENRHGGDCPCGCLTPCPECRAGKHQNCDGQTWDNDRDEPGVCPCWVTHEKED